MKPWTIGITEDQVREIRALRLGGSTYREIAQKFGIGETTASDIANGRRRGGVARADMSTANLVPMMAGRTPAAARRAELKATAEQQRVSGEKKRAAAELREATKHGRDPDVKLYRQEKVGFQTRVAQKMEEARAEFMACLDRMAKARKGGRPKNQYRRSTA